MIKCPRNTMSKDERIKSIYSEFEKWISSPEMYELIEITGGKKSDFVSFYDKFNWMYDYSRCWDFRARMSNGGERWKIEDRDVYEERAIEIINIARRMGLEDEMVVENQPHYILPLGGARMSNYTRCELTKRIKEQWGNGIKAIVALSGLRELNEVEIPFIGTYAPGAKNEFEAISTALESLFNLEKENCMEERYDSENLNQSWIKREYKTNDEIRFVSLAAPSSDASRRANSFDTFEFFLESFDINENDNILAVTSSIYVPFQTIKFMSLAIENNLNIEFTGGAAGAFNKSSNYCQEIKATFDAMKQFMDMYPI